MEQKDKLLLSNEVQEMLGISRSSLKGYMYSKTNPMPFIKLGHRTIRFIESKIIDWLKSKEFKNEAV